MKSTKSTYEKSICAAITSGWWVILGTVVLITLYYAIYLWMVTHQPSWVLVFLGPFVSWASFQQICLWALVAMKLILWVMIGMVAWLMLWSRQMKKLQ